MAILLPSRLGFRFDLSCRDKARASDDWVATRTNRLALVLAFVLAMLAGSASASAASCSDAVPAGLPGPYPDAVSWPFGDACYVIWPGGYSDTVQMYERKCKALPGYLYFEGDHGSNKNICIYRASPDDGQSGTDTSPDQNHSVDQNNFSCAAGEKTCYGKCIPDDASCCSNGHGTFCRNRTTCCFNPNHPDQSNGYICCGGGQQCVYAEGPTAGVCVSPDDTENSLRPEPQQDNAFRARICNHSGAQVNVVQMHTSGNFYVLDGWYPIGNGLCQTYTWQMGGYTSTYFGYHAEGGGLSWWNRDGADRNYCVLYRKMEGIGTMSNCVADLVLVGFKIVSVTAGGTVDVDFHR